MKKLFLSSSFADVYELFPDFAGENISGKTVTFIPTAGIPEEYTGYIDNDKKAFEKLGMVVDELEISTENFATIKEKIEKNDYIFVSGGNTFFLLEKLKEKWLDEIIKNETQKGKIYIGTSAGSIIIAKNIDYIETMDDKTVMKNPENTDGLGLVDFYIVPHFWNFPFVEISQKIVEKYKNLPMKAISNHQVICVKGEKMEIKSK